MVWTDVVQFLVFFLSYGVIAFLLLDEFLWNPSEIYLIASSKESGITGYPHTSMVSFEFSLAVEATFWAILFSRFQTALQFGADQIHVQRVLTTRSEADMFRAFASYAVWSLIFSVICTLIGWALVAFYDRHPDLADSLDHPDQVLVQLRRRPRAGPGSGPDHGWSSGRHHVHPELGHQLHEQHHHGGLLFAVLA